MTGLATITDRELRQIVRRRGIYRLRSGGVAAAIALGVVILFSNLTSASPGGMGRDVFNAMLWLTFAFNLIAGPMFAADSVSEERRDGTLGLLMITPLRSHEVIAGKLVALFMPGLQLMLAILPVFSLAFFIGGISPGEVGRALLVLVFTLYLSMAVALGCSCLFRRGTNAVLMSSALLAALAIALPLARFNPWTKTIASGALSWPSPTYALELVQTSHYGSSAAEFWLSLATLLLIGLGLVVSGGFAVTMNWRDRSLHQKKAHSWKRPNLLSRRKRKPHSSSWRLDRDPLLWLTGRFRGGLRWTWAVLLAMIAVWIGCNRIWHSLVFDAVAIFLSIHLANLILKLWLTWHACHRLADDRRSGAMELLLSLPMEEKAVWGSWLLHLKQRLFWPCLALITMEASLVVAGTLVLGLDLGETLLMGQSLLLATFILLADAYTLSWAAISYSLTSRGSGSALVKTLTAVLIVPFGCLFLIAGILGSAPPDDLGSVTTFLWISAGVTFSADLFIGAQAMARVQDSFRTLIANPSGRLPDRNLAWKTLSATRRRRLVGR